MEDAAKRCIFSEEPAAVLTDGETVGHTISQPFFKGSAKAINPNVVYSTVQMSEPECIETIELP